MNQTPKREWPARLPGDHMLTFPCSADYKDKLDAAAKELGAPNRRELFRLAVQLLADMTDQGVRPWEEDQDEQV